MLCSVVTLNHHSRLLTPPGRTLLSRYMAFASARSDTAQNAIYMRERPLFSHTYKLLLPQPVWIVIDANCRVPTPPLSANHRCACILLVIHNKQTRGDVVTLVKKPLKQQRNGDNTIHCCGIRNRQTDVRSILMRFQIWNAALRSTRRITDEMSSVRRREF
jgi:hypothetical protein